MKGGREAVPGEPTDPGPGRKDRNHAAPSTVASSSPPDAFPHLEDEPDPDPGPSRPDRARSAAHGRRTQSDNSSGPRTGARARSDVPLLARGARHDAPGLRRAFDLLRR